MSVSFRGDGLPSISSIIRKDTVLVRVRSTDKVRGKDLGVFETVDVSL